MKKIAIAFLFLLGYSIPALCQWHGLKTSTQQQNLEETERWLTEQLLEHSLYDSHREKYNFTIKVASVYFDGCSVLINHVTTGSTPRRSSYSANLADLDPLKIKLLKMKNRPDTQLYVQLNTLEMKDKVRFTSHSQVMDQDRMMTYLGLYFRDQEIANKVAEAFAQAINFCQKESATGHTP